FYFLDSPPDGWDNVSLLTNGVGPHWNLNPGVDYADTPNIAGGLGNYALADSSAFDSMYAALVTASQALTARTYAAVQFHYTLQGGTGLVEYSTDGGAWQPLARLYAGSKVSWFRRLGALTAGASSLRF